MVTSGFPFYAFMVISISLLRRPPSSERLLSLRRDSQSLGDATLVRKNGQNFFYSRTGEKMSQEEMDELNGTTKHNVKSQNNLKSSTSSHILNSRLATVFPSQNSIDTIVNKMIPPTILPQDGHSTLPQITLIPQKNTVLQNPGENKQVLLPVSPSLLPATQLFSQETQEKTTEIKGIPSLATGLTSKIGHSAVQEASSIPTQLGELSYEVAATVIESTPANPHHPVTVKPVEAIKLSNFATEESEHSHLSTGSSARRKKSFSLDLPQEDTEDGGSFGERGVEIEDTRM